MQIVYARNSGVTNFMSDKALYLNNCGYYKDLDSDIVINRPTGRQDYHILMTSSGNIFIGEHQLSKGQCYLYYPSTPQHYKYECGEGSEYYWIHFSGETVPDHIERYGLHEGVIDLRSSRGEVERIVKMMIRAFSENYKNADEYCEGMLIAALALISSPPLISSPFQKAIKIFGDPTRFDTVEEVASLYNMTPNHFIRSFKQYTGISPNAFRIKRRMETAEELLISTEMSVSHVAVAVGYSDPLYFSRLFKNYAGSSPTEYRKSKRG